MAAEKGLLFVGTFGSFAGTAGGRGIHVFARDRATGALTEVSEPYPVNGPSFLTVHPDLRTLYAADYQGAGGVRALAVEQDGQLRDLGWRAGGDMPPCHLTVTDDGRHLVGATYAPGSVSIHPVQPDGGLGELTDLFRPEGCGPDPDRQEASHVHHVSQGVGGCIRVVDLGTDTILEFSVDVFQGRLRPIRALALRSGSGPRHLAAHPDGRILLVNELEATVSVLREGPAGVMGEEQCVPATIDRPAQRNYPSEIAISADGRFAYVANRGPDTITTFDVAEGRLRPLAETSVHGAWPRHFALVGQHLYVANERSHEVTVFAVDPESGVPAYLGSVGVQSPACVLPYDVRHE